MWFRLPGNGNNTVESVESATNGTTIIEDAPVAATATDVPSAEPSKFEKFRRGSFRRKSSGQQPLVKKRSKSPHAMLQPPRKSSLAETSEEHTAEYLNAGLNGNGNGNEQVPDSEASVANSATAEQPSPVERYKNEVNIELNATTPFAPTNSDKNFEPPKRKFYQNFTGVQRRQNSRKNAAVVPDEKSVKNTIETTSESAPAQCDLDGDLPLRAAKEKILLTDPKYKHNRIEKSSSKTKISELEKRESVKRSRSGRVISTAAAQQLLDEHKKAAENKKDTKHKRTHSNLNLQALVKFVMNNKKFLNTEDFALIRRKSISEAASAVIAVASTCKPMPIALKYSEDDVVAAAPKENDTKAERNVVLVKKKELSDSFCERNNNYGENMDCKHGQLCGGVYNRKAAVAAKVKRNSSNSSKSSGNFEDEAFYSCDDLDLESKLKEGDDVDTPIPDDMPSSITNDLQSKRKSSSPSLTSRVAAKINETTNNYKNRKALAAANKNAKKRKGLSNGGLNGNGSTSERPEVYKQINVERLHASAIVRQPSDRRPDAVNVSLRSNGNAAHNSSDLQSSFHATVAGDASGTDAAHSGAGGTGGVTAANTAADVNAQDAVEGKDARRERLHHQHQQNKSAPVSVNRSESYKERMSHKRNRTSRRKTSDPSLTSRPNDDPADVGLANSNHTASSNSSLSSGGGLESPSTSMEQVGGVSTSGAAAQHHHSTHAHHTPHQSHQHSHQDSFHGSMTGSSSNASFWSGSGGGGPLGPALGQLVRQWNFESDEEDDLNEADWSSNVAAEVLAALTDAEKKRQEIINEIYQTERSHVRTLKLLDRLFFCPLQENSVLSHDHLMLLFPPALHNLRELHGAFEVKLKQRRIEHNHVVSQVGDLLTWMFDGDSGEELCDFAAQFCARQQIALEALKEKRRKDEQLQKILSKAESHKACRRLQLKDLLPTVLQRLTKYPLLFENLYKVTVRVVPENTSEAEAIQRALESSKKILVDVNQAVKTAEDAHKLQNIQRKLDKSTFDKDEFKNLDLTQYRLIHDGSLTMKKNPSIQLHGLLFENMIVLLTKQDDKYSLKYLQATRNAEVNNKPVSPIMSIDSETLVRQEAADKNSFFLIKTKTSQMLELRAPSSSECKTWFKHISDAAEQYKPRSKNANHEPVDDPAIATLPHSNTKESLELAPERPPPLSATATVTTTPLAPMLPPATVTATHTNNNEVQLRNGRRESTPTAEQQHQSSSSTAASGIAHHKQRLSHNELAPAAVNRTMSTRSCGEANNNNNYSNDVVTLRHTQSARQAADDNSSAAANGSSKRDSASIVYSHNSNNTRTLMQSSAPLVEPTAIQISISPAHTAEPVLTPSERLRRLDATIRDGLYEKQKIICDMFRLPVEHFHEIVDIAAMPEAPKDSADIALAAYAQVQSLTEVLNDYMIVTPEQEISAVSTAVCDQCHEKQQQQQHRQRSSTSLAATYSSTNSTSSAITQISAQDAPPPLPPPNKQSAQAQQQTPAPAVHKLQTPILDEADIHEDDDGYCEIDELRLPALPPLTAAKNKTATPPSPLPAGGSLKAPTTSQAPATTAAAAKTPELVKRESTISSDSIPEESADEVTQANMDDGVIGAASNAADESNAADDAKQQQQQQQTTAEEQPKPDADEQLAKISKISTSTTSQEQQDVAVVPTEETTDAEKSDTSAPAATDSSEHMEVNDAYDTLASLQKLSTTLAMVDNMTQTVPSMPAVGTNANGGLSLCGPNRLQHANSLEPSVPCHALNSIVSALNAQISLLLPKINERDMERERLRKENQHLRELLNAMHERQRVEANLETPSADDSNDNANANANANPNANANVNADTDANANDDDIDDCTISSTTSTPIPPTAANVIATGTAVIIAAEKLDD